MFFSDDFLTDVETIRKLARRNLDNGALTEANKAERTALIQGLEAALATEWICVLRYQQHAVAASGINADHVAKHFSNHAMEELEHANQLAERLKQLGHTPSLDPAFLVQRSHSEYREAATLAEMIKENLIAERIAIMSYTELIRHIGDRDPTTRRILEYILAKEEEHADEMADLLAAFDPREVPH